TQDATARVRHPDEPRTSDGGAHLPHSAPGVAALVAVDRGAVRGGRIGGRHTRRPTGRLTAGDKRCGARSSGLTSPTPDSDTFMQRTLGLQADIDLAANISSSRRICMISPGFETTDPFTQTRTVVLKGARETSGRGW